MTAFMYKARDINGLLVSGVLEGDSIEPVRQNLAEQGLIPISVSKKGAFSNDIMSGKMFQSVKGEEIMLFTRQFHTLFKAGMDMETILNTLAMQTKNKFFSESILRIKSDVAAGSSLAQAFAKHPKVFDKLYTNMLATGEAAGILDNILDQLAVLLEKEIGLKSSVKSATLYPKIVIFVLVMATFVLMTFVMPKFESFYGHYKADLPLPTEILIGTSKFFRDYTWAVVLIIAALVFAYKKWAATTRGRFIMDQLIWKVPIFGTLGQKVANARFAHILGSLYKAGLPITRGLAITSGTIGNEAFSRDVLFIQAEVERGKSISQAMRQTKYLNPLLIEATSIAERTGAIDEMYNAIGSHFDAEINHTLKNLTTLIEPILLGLIFGIITVFILAVFLPIWNMSKIVH